jgi:tRNA pseudouridine38-40 synthase
MIGALFWTILLTGSHSFRYRARVAYDGAGFSGFQAQQNKARTVQSLLEQVLSQRCLGIHNISLEEERSVKVVAAGRTDAGVHARGQAIHFDLPNELDENVLQEIEYSLNQMLSKDVRLWNMQRAPPAIFKTIHGKERPMKWNVMYESTQKLYSYRLSLGGVMHPVDRHTRWHPGYSSQPINAAELYRLLQNFVGTHDYRAFAGQIEQLEKNRPSSLQTPLDTFRTVYKVDLVHEKDHYYRIDFILKGALYKQVRNMVGTVLDVYYKRGQMQQEEDLQRLLQPGGKRMDNKSKPAPPQGLTMEHVYFENDEHF